MSSNNFINFLLNIQEENIIINESDFSTFENKNSIKIKVIKGTLKDKTCSCPHCNSKNIVKNSTRTRKIM